MITICIIVDQEDQYQKIEEALLYVRENFFDKESVPSKYYFKVEGIKCWQNTPNELLDKLSEIEPDIIILDYELRWGENKEPWNGDRVIQKIKNETSTDYQIIVTSSVLFDKYQNNNFFVSFFRRRPKRNLDLPELIGKEYFIDDNEWDELEEFIKEIIDKSLKESPRIEFEHFEYPSSISGSDSFKYYDEHSIDKSYFYQDDIIGIFVRRYDYCIVHIVDQEIRANLLRFKGDLAKSDMGKLLKNSGLNKMHDEPGVFLNSKYASYKRKVITLNKSLSPRTRCNLKSFLKERLKETYSVQKSRERLEDTNPFANSFEQFFKNEELEEIRNV